MTVAQPAMRKRLASMFMKAVNLALPPRCLGCGLIVEQDDSLCVACWSGLSFIRAPRCATCGVPFETDLGEAALCAPCMEERPTFNGARAAIVYAELPRKIMMRFKYGGRTHMARMMARHIRLAASEWLDAPGSLIIPVPLARWRLWRRGYNQAGLIARALARDSAAALMLDGLVRRRATASSGGLGRKQRFQNVRGAFRVAEKARPQIKGRNVLLIDDVMTTGATAGACARELLRAGATSVHVLTWARALPFKTLDS